jgi:hypothetical protein
MPKLVSGIAEKIENDCCILRICESVKLLLEGFDIRFCGHPARLGEIDHDCTICFENGLEAAEVTRTCQNNRQYLCSLLASLCLSRRFPCEDGLGVCGERKTSTQRGGEGEEQLVCRLTVKSEDYGRACAGGTEVKN